MAQRRRLSAHPSPECKTCQTCEMCIAWSEISDLGHGSILSLSQNWIVYVAILSPPQKKKNPYGAFLLGICFGLTLKNLPPIFPAWYLFPAELESLCCSFISVFMRHRGGKSVENGFLPSSDTNTWMVRMNYWGCHTPTSQWSPSDMMADC